MADLLTGLGLKPTVGVLFLSALVLGLSVGSLAWPVLQVVQVFFVGLLAFVAFRVAVRLESLERRYFAVCDEAEYWQGMAKRVGRNEKA